MEDIKLITHIEKFSNGDLTSYIEAFQLEKGSTIFVTIEEEYMEYRAQVKLTKEQAQELGIWLIENSK